MYTKFSWEFSILDTRTVSKELQKIIYRCFTPYGLIIVGCLHSHQLATFHERKQVHVTDHWMTLQTACQCELKWLLWHSNSYQECNCFYVDNVNANNRRRWPFEVNYTVLQPLSLQRICIYGPTIVTSRNKFSSNRLINCTNRIYSRGIASTTLYFGPRKLGTKQNPALLINMPRFCYSARYMQ